MFAFVYGLPFPSRGSLGTTLELTIESKLILAGKRQPLALFHLGVIIGELITWTASL